MRGVPLIWRLNTPLCDQGDTGRVWYRTLHTQLVKQGFARSQSDPCLYVKVYADGTSTDISVYVDDLFITTDAGAEADLDIEALNLKFTMTVRENPAYFLGMNITYIRRGVIRLTCSTYAHTLAGRFPDVAQQRAKVHPE